MLGAGTQFQTMTIVSADGQEQNVLIPISSNGTPSAMANLQTSLSSSPQQTIVSPSATAQAVITSTGQILNLASLQPMESTTPTPGASGAPAQPMQAIQIPQQQATTQV